MSRPTRVFIDSTALIHNVNQIRGHAPNKKIIAMVKANAYGCGFNHVIPVLNDKVEAFGVACLEEAMIIRNLGSRIDCILFQGVFSQEEYHKVAVERLQCVIHHKLQLDWLVNTPLNEPIQIWIKVDTGMHRLGFHPQEVYEVAQTLSCCPWVQDKLGIITHLANADEPTSSLNQMQLDQFNSLNLPNHPFIRSMANSAAIISLPEAHHDAIRPGIMLYGVSPFADLLGQEIGLRPVMHFSSAVSAIHHYSAHSPIGYGGAWQSAKPAIIGIVPAGYGDGYPRHVCKAMVNIRGMNVPVVGRVSMDMMTIDLTEHPSIKIGDPVELWGTHMPVETIAEAAGTIPYELLSQVTHRVTLSS